LQEVTLQSIRRVVANMSLGFLGILLMTVVLGQCSDSSERLGGHWSTHTTGSFIIEAGAGPPVRLEHRSGLRRTVVAENPFPAVYIGDDCVLFTQSVGWSDFSNSGSSQPLKELRAACGKQHSIPVARFRDRLDRAEMLADPLTVGGKRLSRADIKAHAVRGEPMFR